MKPFTRQLSRKLFQELASRAKGSEPDRQAAEFISKHTISGSKPPSAPQILATPERTPEERSEMTGGEKLRIADPVIIAQELDIDYTASIEGVCIPAAWVRSAVNLNLKINGRNTAGWDIADEGRSVNVLIVRNGPVVLNVETWARMDIIQSAHRAVALCWDLDVALLNYDCIRVGAGAKGVFNAKERESREGLGFSTIAINVAEPPSDSRWPDGKTSKERFRNKRAELWWKLRERFEKTHAHVRYLIENNLYKYGDNDSNNESEQLTGSPLPFTGNDSEQQTDSPRPFTGEGGLPAAPSVSEDEAVGGVRAEDQGVCFPEDELISIPDNPELIAQLSMPLHFYTETGKVQIESKKDLQKRGIASPDYADALVLAFATTAILWPPQYLNTRPKFRVPRGNEW